MNIKLKDCAVKNKVIKLYKSGLSMRKIANQFDVSPMTINNLLIRENIPRKSPGNYRTYTLNEEYFNTIDTEDKAYFFGFILADGSVYKNRSNSMLQINLQKRDKPLLEGFKRYIGSNKPLFYIEKTKSYNLCLSSPKIYNSLLRLGCKPNKTTDLTFPEVPKEQLHHFMRGYFDGDGCVRCFQNKSNYTRQSFSIVSTKQFAEVYGLKLSQFCDIRRPTLFKHTQSFVWNIRYDGREDVKKIQTFLYNNATIFLKRKYDIFNSIP